MLKKAVKRNVQQNVFNPLSLNIFIMYKGLDSFIDFVEWLLHNANIKDTVFH